MYTVLYTRVYVTYIYIYICIQQLDEEEEFYCEKVCLLTIYLGGRSPGCSSPRSAAIEHLILDLSLVLRSKREL